MAAELVLHNARLDANPLLLDVRLEDLVHVLREVDVNRFADGLAREAGGAAARQDGDAVLGGDAHGLDYIALVARDYGADRLDLPSAGIGRIKDTGVRVEADFAFDRSAKCGF